MIPTDVNKKWLEDHDRGAREKMIDNIKQNCIMKSTFIPEINETIDYYLVTKSVLEYLRENDDYYDSENYQALQYARGNRDPGGEEL
ncbi:MAG TPA: hypothetical protein VMW91_02290 [Desulfosporosinus sp.]|nr:hypothetical protein [Desulfosporosinus sp.]